jgi:cellulose synthase/poly-beta-1,6-N-acetylglucosamine synthase-like glycosyltransferase
MGLTIDYYFALTMLFWLSVAGIFYTYFGYPLLIAILATLFPKAADFNEETPTVTLLIAAYNEEDVIEGKIQNCLAIEYPRDKLQILVITDGSSDRTPQIVNQHTTENVALLHQPERRGKMAAINRALASIESEIVVFSDANNYYQPQTLRKLLFPFGNPGVGATTGAKLIQKGDGSLGESEGFYWKYESFIKSQESKLGSCTSAAGEILAIRKKLFVPPPEKTINDDFFIAMQILKQGYRLIYVPDAKSIERVSPTAEDEIIRRTRINAGRFQAMAMSRNILPFNQPYLIWQIFSHKFLRPFVPFCMIFIAISNVLLVLFPAAASPFSSPGKPFYATMLALQILFYGLAGLGARLDNQVNQSKIKKMIYLATFLVNSNLAALRGFIQFAKGQQSHIWDRIQRRS